MNPFDKILKGNSQTNSLSQAGLYDDIVGNMSSSTKPKGPSLLKKAFGFGKEIILDTKKNVIDKPLTNVVQAAQVASKLPEIIKTGKATFTPMTPFNYKGTPVQPLGTRTADNGFTKENVKKDLLDIGGTGLEMASFLGFGPSAKAGFQATKELVKGSTKVGVQTLKRSMAEGAFGGLTQNIGTQLQDKAATGKAFNPMETVKATAWGAVFAPALNIVSRGLGKMVGGKKTENVLEEAFAKPKLTSEDRYAQYRESVGYEPYRNPDKLPEIKMGAKPKPTTPVIEYGKTSPSTIIPEAKVQPKTQIPTSNMINSPEDVDRVLSGIMRDGKKAPELAEQVAKETVQPNVIPEEVFRKADNIVDEMPDSNIMTPFERQTNIEQIASIMSRPQDDIFNIVKGNMELPDNIPRDAYLSVAKNIVDETTDPKLKAKLSIELLPYRKEISSKSGQKLQANVIAKKDNIVDILGEIEDTKFKKLSKDAQLRYSKELEDAIQTVQREFESIKNLPGTREQKLAALSKLIC